MSLISLVVGMTLMIALLLVLNGHISTEIQVQALVFNILTLCLGFYIASVINRRNQTKNSVSNIQVSQLNRNINTLDGLQNQIYDNKRIHLHNVVSIIKLLRSTLSNTAEDVDSKRSFNNQEETFKHRISEQFSMLNTMLTDAQYCTTIGKPNCIKIDNSVIYVSEDYIHDVCHQIEVCITLIYTLQVSLATQQ